MDAISRSRTVRFVAYCVFGLVAFAPVITAAPTCTPSLNPIPEENEKPGTPQSTWDLNCTPGAPECDGPQHIQGFASEISVNRGEQVDFKVRITGATNPAFTLDIYRMGYYGGAGARHVATVNGQQSGNQPACDFDSVTGLVDCGEWAVNATWDGTENSTPVPSGIYFAKLTSAAVTGASHIFFIIRDDSGCSDLLFQTSDTTWQAYNGFSDGRGRIDFYYRYDINPNVNPSVHRAYKLSYNRPFNARGASANGGGPVSWIFNAEYPMVRWLEANGYHVSYTTGVDTDRRGPELLEHKIFLSVGHDEYWSAGQRSNVETARAEGVHLAFFSGNEIVWKTRWEDNHQTLVCYKESLGTADPGTEWTGTWRDPAGGPPSDGKPENALLGNLFTTNNITGWPVPNPPLPSVQVSQQDGLLRFWRNTAVSTQTPGATRSLAIGTLGFEYDTDLDNGFRPAGLIRLSTTPGTAAGPAFHLTDAFGAGVTYDGGADTHHVTLYRHSSGALVFSAGTIQWSWGLDCRHDRGDDCSAYDASAVERENVRTMRQAMVNLFADMDVQPDDLQAPLTIAAASTDTTGPVSVITAPATGASLAKDYVVTITGTASDSGGGIVGAVEVSVDGGTTWHPATGRATWSYAWTPTQTATVVIRTRAVDDSGNLETPSSGRTVSVIAGTRSPGTVLAVPGIIQAEDFDNGADGSAYHDLTPVNSGGSYRTTGVDITQCATSCSRIVGYVQEGEWLAYTIDVATTGTYDIAVYGSHGSTGGEFHIEVDSSNVTGTMSIANTGDNWIIKGSYSAGVPLTAGQHVLKIVMDENAAHGWVGNFDYIRISRAYNANAFAVPGSFEAEDFNEGGEAVAYHDLTGANSGGAYRSTGVDITQCPAGTQCNYIVGYAEALEWLEYSIDVTTSGTYTFAVQGTAGSTGGAFHIEIDGSDVTNALSVANTGSNWIVGTTTKTGVLLEAGPHVLRIAMDQVAAHGWVGNFDKVTISGPD